MERKRGKSKRGREKGDIWRERKGIFGKRNREIFLEIKKKKNKVYLKNCIFVTALHSFAFPSRI